MASLLTVKQVAGLLATKPSTIYAWSEQGQIPCYKLNGSLRFREEEIWLWIGDCKKGGNPVKIEVGRRPRKGG